MPLIDGYAVVENGKLIVATVYETAGLAKYHYLSFNSGDYHQDDFTSRGLNWNVEFENYPEATVVPVSISVVVH